MVSQRFTDVTQVKKMLGELRLIGDERGGQDFKRIVARLEAHRQPEKGADHAPLTPRHLLRELTTRRPSTGSSLFDSVDSFTDLLTAEHDRLPEWARHYDPVDEVEDWSRVDEADAEADAKAEGVYRDKSSNLPQNFAKLERGKKIQRALDFFDAQGLPIAAALLMRSLPEAYTSKRGSQILDITGHLVSDPVFRVRQTASFVVTVMTPDPAGPYANAGSLLPGRRASSEVRRIRLIHAAVRELFKHDHQAKERYELAMEELDAAVNRGESSVPGHLGPDARTRQEVPISQAQLLATLLTFTVVVFQVLDQLGVPYDEEDKEAHFFLWSVVAAYLGLGDPAAAEPGRRDALENVDYYGDGCRLLPITPEEGERLWEVIVDEERGETAEGQVLTNALLQELSRTLPQGMKPAPAAMMRNLLGDEVADMLGVPIGGWAQFAYDRLGGRRFVARRARKRQAVGSLRRAFNTELSARLSRAAINGFMAIDDPRFPEFTLPDQLAEQWCMHKSTGSRSLASWEDVIRPAGEEPSSCPWGQTS